MPANSRHRKKGQAMSTEVNKIAALSAEPAQEMTDERICDLMGWNVEAMQQNEPEDLPTRVRALVRVAEAEAVAADRASRLPEIGDGDWPPLPPQGAESPDPQLLKFYAVSDYPSLVAAMLHHIEKLQAKLPKDGQPLLTRVRA